MSQVSLATAKQHCAVSPDFVGHDTLLQGYIDAAEAHVLQHVRRDLDTEFPTGWPSDIIQAVLMIVGHFYANREAVAVGTIAGNVPMSAKMLLEPHRDYIA